MLLCQLVSVGLAKTYRARGGGLCTHLHHTAALSAVTQQSATAANAFRVLSMSHISAHALSEVCASGQIRQHLHGPSTSLGNTSMCSEQCTYTQENPKHHKVSHHAGLLAQALAQRGGRSLTNSGT